MAKIVGVGDCATSISPRETIVTYALASCIAVTAYSPSKKAAGMVHIILPDSSGKQKDSLGPYYYADTGIPLLIDRMCSEYGCLRSELKIKMFGGANSIRVEDIFKLGYKNRQMAEKILNEMRLPFDASETGGVISRTLEMDVTTGSVIVKYQPITI